MVGACLESTDLGVGRGRVRGNFLEEFHLSYPSRALPNAPKTSLQNEFPKRMHFPACLIFLSKIIITFYF